jgi:hypothetical protein
MSETTEHGLDHGKGIPENEQSTMKTPVQKYGWTPHPDLSEEEAASIHVRYAHLVIDVTIC